MIYFDNAATTPLKKEVLDEMLPYLSTDFYNPSSIYSPAQKVRSALNTAREITATAIGAKPREIYYTSCGTEAINWALKGAAMMMKKKGKTGILVSSIEHHAVLHCAEKLKKDGFDVTFLPVDENGTVTAQTLKDAINENVGLCSIMMGNNEIGTVQEIKTLCDIAHESKIVFHTDAVQAVGSIKVDVAELGVDMLTFSAHKFGGPKGVGALYIKTATAVETLLDGGAQENNRRAGTENVAGIIGLAKAIDLAVKSLDERQKYVESLREMLIEEISQNIPKVRFNGNPKSHLPGIVSASFEGIEGEGILLMLDMKGVAASSGSACASGSLDPSHVILATGLSHGIAQGTIRFSLSADNTAQEVKTVAGELIAIVERLRSMSPVWNG